MKDYEILLKKLISKANKDDFNILFYTIEPGERPIFGKLQNDGYIKNVRFRGHQYVGLDLTYEGVHYFDKKDEEPENVEKKKEPNKKCMMSFCRMQVRIKLHMLKN